MTNDQESETGCAVEGTRGVEVEYAEINRVGLELNVEHAERQTSMSEITKKRAVSSEGGVSTNLPA